MSMDLFYKLNFSVCIATSTIGLTICTITIFTIIMKRQCHTVSNLLTCNTSFIVGIYLIFSCISSIYGLEESRALVQPLCHFRAYAFVVGCTLLLYSHLTHAVSRLFFIRFFNRPSLLSWRTHWIMVVINWPLGLVLPLVPFFVEGAYIYEPESRLCTCTTKKTVTSIYGIVTSFIIPFNTMVIIYIKLVHHACRSSRRVQPSQTTSTVATPNMRREMRLVRNMCILLGIMLGGGIPYLCMVIWHAITSEPAPHSLYLLIINSIHICTALMMAALFMLNQQVKKNAWESGQKLFKFAFMRR